MTLRFPVQCTSPDALFETVLHETLQLPRWRELTVDLAFIRGAIRRVFPVDEYDLSDDDVQRIAALALEVYRTEKGDTSDEAVCDMPRVPDPDGDEVVDVIDTTDPSVSADLISDSLGSVIATDNDYDLEDSFIDDGVRPLTLSHSLCLEMILTMWHLSCRPGNTFRIFLFFLSAISSNLDTML